MKNYVKKNTDGSLEFAPHVKRNGSRLTIGYNLVKNEKQLLADGYRIYIETPRPQDGKIYERVLEETDTELREKWLEHHLSDLELEQKRHKMFNEISDPLFIQVQRGALDAEEYIRAVAEIKYENRYSNEQNKSFDDFFNEAAGQWNNCHPDMPVAVKAA